MGVLSGVAQAAELPVYELKIKAGLFEPKSLPIPAGEKFQLKISNEGPGAEEFESSDLNREKVVPPGKSVIVFLGPLKAGSYHYFGEFHPETAHGELLAR